MSGLTGATPVIDEFMEHYVREIDHFREAARLCAEQCESLLRENGVRAITTFRAKRHERLRDKLEQRNRKKNYQSLTDIYGDIPDFAGVRLALYFPGDRNEVGRLIADRFSVAASKSFPLDAKRSTQHDWVFSGYSADHYRVRLKDPSLQEAQRHYSRTNIEIQVASVLMHAWSEVEHDLVYKPQAGSLSSAEYSIIDQVNGLVLSGEIALKLLQDAIRARAAEPGRPFRNHYELASYLLDATQKELAKPEPSMGRVDVLHRFLQGAGVDKPEFVKKYIAGLDSTAEAPPIAAQVTDRILHEKPELIDLHNKARSELDGPSPYTHGPEKVREAYEAAVGSFLAKWIMLERLMAFVNEKLFKDRRVWPLRIEALIKSNVMDKRSIEVFERMRKFRSEVVHGAARPTATELSAAGDALSLLINQLADRFKQSIPQESATIDEIIALSKK